MKSSNPLVTTHSVGIREITKIMETYKFLRYASAGKQKNEREVVFLLPSRLICLNVNKNKLTRLNVVNKEWTRPNIYI